MNKIKAKDISNLEIALKYLNRGFSVIPIKPNSKDPLIGWKKYQTQLPTEDEVREWWEEHPDANIAIITGKVSGICVLEIDDEDILEELEIPLTVTGISGGKRLPHYFFRYKKGIPSFSHQHDGKEVFSFRSDGFYIVVPPSVHESGGIYEWEDGCSFEEIELAELPECLFEYMSKSVEHELNKEFLYFNEECDSRNIVKQVKDKVLFSKLLMHLGFEGQECKGYWKFRCPFHDDGNNHDFVVWDEICGAIDYHDGEGYDPIKFLREINGWSFQKALDYLKDFAGIETNISTKQNNVDEVVNLIKDLGVTLFHDENNEPYIRYQYDGVYRISKITDEVFKLFVIKEYRERTNKTLNDNTLKTVLNSLKTDAIIDGKKHKLNVRVAEYDSDSVIWYDLGDGRAVRIDSLGWHIVDDPPILFKNFSHQQVQVEPVDTDCKDVYEIFNFVRIKDDDSKLLYIANLVAALIPDIPHPIDVFYGVKGSSKTTACRMKKDIVDPSTLESMSPPNSPNEFIQTCSHHWFLTIDNLSKLPEWLSDTLCRVVTGEGFSKRKLYTDDSDIIYSFKRCIALNGINLVADKPDLLDRALLFELEPIDPKDRKTEKELKLMFEKLKPKILGALFSLLFKARAVLPNIHLSKKARMADFDELGCAVARALGLSDEDFLNAYKRNRDIQNKEALEASTTAECIMILMKDKEDWKGSPSLLLSELITVANVNNIDKESKSFPKTANMVWKRMQEVIPNLKDVGIVCTRDDSSRGKNGRKIKIINLTFSANEEVGDRDMEKEERRIHKLMTPNDSSNKQAVRRRLPRIKRK